MKILGILWKATLVLGVLSLLGTMLITGGVPGCNWFDCGGTISINGFLLIIGIIFLISAVFFHMKERKSKK